MIILRSLFSALARSLATRLVIYVTLVAGFGIGMLILGSMMLVKHQSSLQAQAVQHLAEGKVAERIDSEIRLVAFRLHGFAGELEDSLTAITNLSSTAEAIRGREPRLMRHALGQKLLRAGFTAASIITHRHEILMHLSADANPRDAHKILSTHEMGETLAELIENNDGTTPSVMRRIGKVDEQLATILGLKPEVGYGIMIGIPVFDASGDVDAVILAYRALGRNERILNAFANATGSTIALVQENKMITLAGAQGDAFTIPKERTPPLLTFPSQKMVGRCGEGVPDLSICLLRPEGDVSNFRDEIAAIGQSSAALTQTALMGIAACAVIWIILVVFSLATKLTRPLAHITEDVLRVSGGEWPIKVQHSARQDEIGKIARALVSMQSALIERDKMRQERVQMEALNARRNVLDSALLRFEHGISGVMGNITRTVDTLAQANDVLQKTAREAEQQAHDIRGASQETSTRASVVSNATLHLANTIHQIEARARTMRDVVHESEGHALLAENQLIEVAQSTRNAEEAIGHIHALVADLSGMSLGVSVALSQQVGEGSTQLAFVRQFNALALKASEATAIIETQLSQLGEIADGATLSLSEMKGGLGAALEGSAEISVIIAEQNATTRDIVESFGAASAAMLDLTSAVERLSSSMAEAQEASTEFITLAQSMATDAKMIDNGVRDFVRDAVA